MPAETAVKDTMQSKAGLVENVRSPTSHNNEPPELLAHLAKKSWWNNHSPVPLVRAELIV
jgi:hypothetical protein